VARSRLFALVLGLAIVLPRSALAEPQHVKVVAAEKDNLQYLAFWVAKAGGFFEREGVQVEISVVEPKAPLPIEASLEKGQADAALLSPTAYLRAIAARAPVVVVANLFANDPYALVVRRDVADARKLSVDGPLRDRLAALKGITVGVPPPAFGRFRSLLVTQGLDIDKDVSAEILLARDQVGALERKKVEAMFVATPALENAVASANAVVAVSLPQGEVNELAVRQANVLAVSRAMLTERREVVISVVRAIAQAEKRIHEAQGEAVEALARELPARDRRELEAAVRLYEPAVPQTPEVRAQDLPPALALIPENVPKPDLAGIDLAPFVAPDLLGSTTTTPSLRTIAAAVAPAFALVLVLVIVRRRHRRT
jgi:NitT/TauT family transport system substrate-binding protein